MGNPVNQNSRFLRTTFTLLGKILSGGSVLPRATHGIPAGNPIYPRKLC